MHHHNGQHVVHSRGAAEWVLNKINISNIHIKENVFESWKRHCVDSYPKWQISQSDCKISSGCGKMYYFQAFMRQQCLMVHTYLQYMLILPYLWHQSKNMIVFVLIDLTLSRKHFKWLLLMYSILRLLPWCTFIERKILCLSCVNNSLTSEKKILRIMFTTFGQRVSEWFLYLICFSFEQCMISILFATMWNSFFFFAWPLQKLLERNKYFTE